MIKEVEFQFSRRAFLKGATALSAAALTACGKDTETIIETVTSGVPEEEAKLVSSACRANCFNGCHLWAHVKNGRVVKTSMAPMDDERYNRVCLRGLSHIMQLYGSHRVLYPLKRTGERGEGKWERISWPKAVKEISDSFKSIINSSTNKQPNGADAKGSAIGYLEGSGNYGGIGGCGNGLTARLFQCLQSTSIAMAVDAALSTRPGNVCGWGRTNEYADYANTKTIFAWGTNVSESQLPNWHFIADAVENGARLISIDVMFNPTAARANRFVNIRPASDAALMLSMMNRIFARNLYKEAFILENTNAAFLVRADTGKFLRNSDLAVPLIGTGITSASFIIGKLDGSIIAVPMETITPTVRANGSDTIRPDVPKVGESYVGIYDLFYEDAGTHVVLSTPTTVKSALLLLKERVSTWTPSYQEDYTGVAADIVDELVTELSNGPTAFYTGYGLDRYTNGHHNTHSLAVMAAITGNYGIAGTGLSLFWDYPWYKGAVQNPDNTTLRTSKTINYPNLFDVFNSDNLSTEGNGGPNELFVGGETKIRGLYVAFSNPVGNYVDQNRLINEILTKKDSDGTYKLKTLVVADVVMSDTAEYADYVLPAAHYFEVEDIGTSNNNTHAIYQGQAVEPLGEAKGDADIARLLANELGFKDEFRYTNKEFLEICFSADAHKAFWKRMTGVEIDSNKVITFDKLKAKSSFRTYPGTPQNNYKTPNRRSGTKIVCETPSALFEVYLENPNVRANYGQSFQTGGIINYSSPKFQEECLPMWVEPNEAWQGPTSDSAKLALRNEYPFVMIQEHTRWRVHSQWAENAWLRELDPEPIAKLNEFDAADLGIKTGDIIKITSKRHYVVVKAIVTKGIRKGVVNMHRGWLKRQLIEGSYQAMTNSFIDPVCVNQAFMDVLVKISKVN